MHRKSKRVRIPAILSAVALVGGAFILGGSTAQAESTGLDLGAVGAELPIVEGDGASVSIDGEGLSVDAGVAPTGLQLTADAALDTATFPVAAAIGALLPELSPPGANDFSCVPSAEHPDPVVLVHGTFENAYDNWVQMSGDLAADGYCVFALNYGGYPGIAIKGVGDIPTSAGQLSDFVDVVLEATGAKEVDLVGHSQGGMMPRYYIQNLGGAEKVHQLIGLSPSNYGTDVLGALPVITGLPGGEDLTGIPCEACVQQETDSEFLAALNADGDTRPGVEYTVISTSIDEIVTPYTNTFLRDEGATNLLVQDFCGLDKTEHFGISYDPIAIQLVRNALDPSTAADPACQPVLPLVG